MLLSLFFCLLFTGFTSAYLTVDGCGTSIYQRPRIIGGKPAKSSAYPWMVLLEIGAIGGHTNCGGAILNEYWIVTAAHCFDNYVMERSKAYVGLQYISEKKEYGQELKMSAIVKHPNYNNLNAYDIALIRTTEPIDIEGSEGYVNGICLPETTYSPYPIGKASVIGFGCTDYDMPTKMSDVLQETVVPIFPAGTCAKLYGEKFRDMICAGDEVTSSCFGDSGGPLFQTHNGVSYLIGIVSGGLNKKAIRYTKVASFLDWMRSVVDM